MEIQASVRTQLGQYRPGDTMVIYYSTIKGSVSAQYDLMLRITSKATNNDYYFYDDKSDTSRWIHSSPRPMRTAVPDDGSYQIPWQGMEPILIDDSTPSGEFVMLAYFSAVGRNSPVGYMRLQTRYAHPGGPVLCGHSFIWVAALLRCRNAPCIP